MLRGTLPSGSQPLSALQATAWLFDNICVIIGL